MLSQGVKYNIPVSVWLPEDYPNVAPIMYVVPTPDMIIKPRHAFVDASGIVSCTYLRNWSQPQSNLMIFCNDISIQFGQDPPLFSKPPGWVPPAPAEHHQSSPHRQQQPNRSQSPASQQAAPHSHTFQAENPMIRYACCVYGCLQDSAFGTPQHVHMPVSTCFLRTCPWQRSSLC